MRSRLYLPRVAALVSLFAAFVTVAFAASGFGPDGRASISGKFRNSDIVVSTSSRTAGAIDSLTWNGQQFVNSYDHGRELQSAAQFNNLHECYNPTEAGSRSDGKGSTSTSQLISLETNRNRLTSRSRMAFWLAPGQSSPACRGETAAYASPLSDIELSKTVTIGAHGLPNVIEHDVTFHVPRNYESAVFVGLTAYLPPHFSRFWTFDPNGDVLTPLTDGPGEVRFPVIIATADGAYALGVYAQEPPPGQPRVRYGRWRFDRPGPDNATTKWNCVFRVRGAAAGDYRYTCYSIVGTLEDVKSSMGKLAAALRRRAN